jgi:hypothetical protein
MGVVQLIKCKRPIVASRIRIPTYPWRSLPPIFERLPNLEISYGNCRMKFPG